MSRKTRKLIWSVPLVAVFAVIGALAAFATLAPNDASAQNVGIPPGAPTDLTIVPYADTIPEEELLLTWTEPTDGGSVRQYRIDISHNGGYTWVALESDFRNNSYTHDGLDASTTLHYRVFAVNQHGISPVSNVESGTTDDSTVPDRPTNLTAMVGSSSGDVEATTEDDLMITLRWDPPINPPGAPVKSYVVEYSVDGSRWDPVPDLKKSGGEHTGLSAGEGYQYRVAAVNSVGQSGWSGTDTDETLPAVIPEMPSVSDFEPGVVPEEVNVWLFWEPGADPVGDPVTHYEVEGRPTRHAAIMLGAQPSKMADLRKVVDGPLTEVAADPEADPPVLAINDDNLGHIDVAGIHYTGIYLSGNGTDGDVGTDDNFADVAALLQTAIRDLPTDPWAEDAAIAHPVTVIRLEDHDDDAITDNITVYYSSKRKRDARDTGATGYVPHTDPPSTHWTKVDLDGRDLALAEVTYTGLRFKIEVPVAAGNASAKALPAAKSIDSSPDVASMLGWASSSPGRMSVESVGTFFTADADGNLVTPVLETDAAAPPAWEVVDTDISRPGATKIHQFVVTTADVAGTGYGDHFIANIDWEFRVRAINRRAPAKARNADVAEGGVDISGGQRILEMSWSDPIEATPGSDVALKRPENLVVRRSPADSRGRTGLILEWNKSTTVKDANGVAVDAVMYRIEYSDTGTAQRGYDWKLLQASVDGDDANRQMYVDNEESLSGTANDLKAGQIRHYRVLALRANVDTTADIDENKTSWPSPQQTGNTAPPLRPDAPSDLRATATGHTHVQLVWIAPDASNDDNDGSEEGPTVITHYIVSTSDDEGKTWSDLMDEDGMVLKVMETNYLDDTLMPGQTRDYRVKAVNSSQASVWSNTLDVTTLEAILPNQPGGLVAESAGTTSIKICWNAQAEQPEDAPVFEYLIEHSADGNTGWMELTRVTDIAPVSDEDDAEMQVYTIYTDTTVSPDETRHYRVSAVNLRGQSDQSDVASATTAEAPPNTAPTAGAAIADQTVMVDATVMVQSTITDADTDDTLTWSAMSNMPTYATAEVDNMGMVTITGVAEGMATITVTATDMADATATQDIMVTVEAANTAPTAGAAIADQTVMVDATVMVQSTITDADTDDTLTWSAMSNMPTYATAEVDNMGMVTITGVAEGMATITVTATDMADATATQDIMVTVEAVDTTPMAPTGVRATVDDDDPGSVSVTVIWMDGANVPAYGVVLFSNNFTEWNYIGRGTGGSHTFTNVASGSYIAVVVALDAQGGLMTDAQGNYLYAGATVVTVQ